MSHGRTTQSGKHKSLTGVNKNIKNLYVGGSFFDEKLSSRRKE